jgi:flagellar hook-associated protein 2
MVTDMTSPIRISGFSSGMDIDSMVSSLMKAERMPLDKLKQNKQVLEWQRDDYRSMNTLLLNLRTEAFNMKLTSGYRTKTVTSSDEARVTATASTSAGNSSYSITQVDRLASAATKVSGAISTDQNAKMDSTTALFLNKSKLASGATITWKQGSVESQSLTVGSDETASLNLPTGILLKNDGGTPPIADLSDMVVKVNGTAYKLVNTGNPAADEVSVDASGNLKFGSNVIPGSSVSVSYYTDMKQDKFKPSEATKELQLTKGSIVDGSVSIKFGSTTYTNGISTDATKPDPKKLYDSNGAIVGDIDIDTGKITLNNDIAANTDVTVTYKQNYFTFGMSTNTSKGPVTEKFGVQGSDSLNQVLQKVSNSTLGVSAFYDNFSDKVSLTRTETGNFSGLSPSEAGYVQATDEEIITTDGFLSSVLQFAGKTESGGENAKFTINGLDTERSSNSFDMNGVSITLKKAFLANEGSVSLSINNNIDSVVDKVKKFIDTYNDALTKILDKVSETRYKDYPPLTDDQKQQLSDTQQEQWTTNAKSGLLQRDPILSSILDKMRSNFSSPVSGTDINSKYNNMTSIGITTSSNYLEGGKLYLDESKLRKALQDDPTSVEKLFTSTGTDSGQKGIAQRLYDSVNASMDQIKQRAGNTFSTNQQFAIGKSLNDLDTRISSFEDRMKQVEDRYYRQFTAMEQAMNQANSQSASLASMLGGGK